jgi:hypothetical protein
MGVIVISIMSENTVNLSTKFSSESGLLAGELSKTSRGHC